MKKKYLKVVAAVMAATLVMAGCGLEADTDTDTEIETEDEDEDEDEDVDDSDSEDSSEEKDKDSKDHKSKANQSKDKDNDEYLSKISQALGAAADSAEDETDTSTVEDGIEVSFRGWVSYQGNESLSYFIVEETDTDVGIDSFVNVSLSSEQESFVRANIYEEFEISFVYTQDMDTYFLPEPVSVTIVPDEVVPAGEYDPSQDPLRGLVAEDILTKFRTYVNVKDPDSIYREASNLGYWIQKTIGREGFPEELVEMGTSIGYSNEYCFGTDIANNFYNNFSSMYGVYFTLKDYYNSDGLNSKDFYDGLVEDNEYLGTGNPETIDTMYKDLQEFVTTCNNIIRGE
jgi:hypothetical protein